MTMVNEGGDMKTEISKSAFKARALEIFRQIEQTGEPIIITDRGEPALIIRKYSAAQVSARERLAGSVLRYDDPLDPVGQDDWEANE